MDSGTRLWALAVLAAAAWVAPACGGGGGFADAGDASADGGDGGPDGGDSGADEPDAAVACTGCHASARCEPADDPDDPPRCVCRAGFEHEGDRESPCIDVDECDLGEHDCSEHATCTNSRGSYECECDDGFTGDGETCDDVDECDLDEHDCSEHATCTNTEGRYECECENGFTGDGETCDDVDECAENPCDADATCTNTPGSFTCECNPPQIGSGTSCACDMTGTFAALAEVDVEWDAVRAGPETVLAAGSDTTVSWSIRRQVQSGASIEVEITPCGGTSSDLCSPYYDQAFGQYVPDSAWEAEEMPTFSSLLDVPDPDPGDAFVGPMEVALTGLELPDPFGDWPLAQDDAMITWRDHDGDDGDYAAAPALGPTPLGVTTFFRTSGRSTTCNQDYGGLPIPPTGANRASHIMTGDRARANLEGVLVSCDVMGGRLRGPDTCRGEDNTADVPCFEGRLRNCVRTSGAACSPADVNALDDTLNEPGTRVLASRFVMERVADDVTCAQVRAHTFPPIPE